MCKRKYTHLKIWEAKIVEMKKAGKAKREIADHFGFSKEQAKDLLKRYRRRERMIAAGLNPKPIGRPRKDALPRNKEVEQACEIARLKIENKLLRDFLQSTAVCKIRCDLSSSNRIRSNRYVQFLCRITKRLL